MSIVISEVKLALAKSTKRTHVYSTTEERVPVSTVYVNKIAFNGEPPANVTLTIKEE